MKKIKLVVTAILRLVLLVVPGAAYLWWIWGKVAALVTILAAVGLETLWLVAFSFGVVFVQTWRDRKKSGKASETPQEDTGGELRL